MKVNENGNEELQKQKFLSLLEAQDIVAEVGRTISTKTAKSLDAAVKAMQLAMEQIAVLLSDENEKIETKDGAVVETKRPIWMRWNLEEVSKILAKDDSFDARRCSVQAAIRLKVQNEFLAAKLAAGGSMSEYDYDYNMYPYIRDLYDSDVIYSLGDKLYQATYAISNNGVTVSDGVPVRVSYVAESQSENVEEKGVELIGELVELQERAVNDNGVAKIKIISPGWGSSGYYSEAMLKRDGPKIFKKGTHMYINHPTEEEANNRPERDLKDLAGVLESDGKWDSNGATGPGIYADAKVLPGYRDFIDSAAPYIGTSIRASGEVREGEAEGKYGPIVERLVDAHSVDYVTMPGRGGEVLPLLEAARTSTHDRRDHTKALTELLIQENANANGKENEMTEDQIKALIEESVKSSTSQLVTQNTELQTKLSESSTELARMKEALIFRDAKDVVNSTLAGLNLPDITRNRLAESCAKNPPVKDGALDKDTLVESVKAAAIEEMKYVESFMGVTTGGGKPVGMGLSESKEITEEDADKALREAFSGFGFSDKALEVVVKGRN